MSTPYVCPPASPGGFRLCGLALLCALILGRFCFAELPAVDPLVAASPYGDKTVWSYHGKDPMPWRDFKPRDYGSAKVAFNARSVRSVGRVPAPGVHPRIFFSPEDLPALRARFKDDAAAQAAWKNILAWTNALKLTYDEKADYAQPDWANGGFGVRGRFVDLMRIGGYSPKREDYYALLAAGEAPKYFEKTPPSAFFKPGANEAFRCLIEDDAAGAQTLARATVTAVRLEQERRARSDKPVEPGQPPRPSTSRSDACALGFIYDFIFNYMNAEQRQIVHDELVTLSAWADNYGTFNNAEASRSNWATFSYWVFDLMAIEGEPGFNDLKFLGLYRGWRNFFTYSFFDSGAAYEAEGKLLFGLDAAVAFDRVGHKYGLEPLTQHPLPRAYYGNFSAYAMLPTRDSFAVFDILGSMGGGFTTPQDLVIAKWLYPQDRTTDFVYRALVGDDYKTLPKSIHSHWHQAILSGIFATAYDPKATPDVLGLPLSFFCGQRAVLMTRSSWDKNATFLTMHVRGASGGHPYPDRNGLMLSAQGRTWVTIPGKDIGGWAMNTVLIDGAEQNTTTPGRVVAYVDEPQATFMTGDAKYCWDWIWSSSSKNRQGDILTREDVLTDNIDTGLAWKPVEQSFNDFAWTKSNQETYRRPLKFNAHWIAPDGALSSPLRQPNTPVLKAFRTAGLVRGPRPYVLVMDDVQRDALETRYDWNLSLPADLVQVSPPPPGCQPGDIVLAGKASLDENRALKAGEPALLIRLLENKGTLLPVEIGVREKQNLLSLRTRSSQPDLKVLLHAFRQGEPLPRTVWNPARTTVAVQFPDQTDLIQFTPAASGKTDLVVTRQGRVIAAVNQPIPRLDDPESDALTERVRRVPERVAALRANGYSPLKQPGLVAGWTFATVQDGAFPPWPGSVAAALPIAANDSSTIPGPGARPAASVGKAGLTSPLGFASELKDAFTTAFWIKTKSRPFMGGLFSANAHSGLSLDLVQGNLRLSSFRTWGIGGSNPSSMLSSWTHFAVVYDVENLKLYRNGNLVMTVPSEGRSINWGKELRLGVGDLEAAYADLCFYNRAFNAEDVEALYLWGKHIAASPASASLPVATALPPR